MKMRASNFEENKNIFLEIVFFSSSFSDEMKPNYEAIFTLHYTSVLSINITHQILTKLF